MQHIAPNSPTSTSPMPTRYRPISVRNLRRKSLGTFRARPDFSPTLPDTFHFWVFKCIFAQSRCISRFQLKCSTLPQLRLPRHQRYRPDVACSRSGSFETGPRGRFGQVLTFPRPFLTTFIFVFSVAFLLNREASPDFS